MLKKELIKTLKAKRNLLAFSAGIDSTALFFLLLEKNINFDIIIVNYNLREESKEEILYAKELAKKHNKTIFLKEVNIKESSNFEKKARDIRYSYFSQIIEKFNYNTLLTAHQVDDKLEWFLMQLSKGAGLVELIGLNEIEERDTYTIIRPLLEVTKKDLKSYLIKNDFKYFFDKSNLDPKYKRNYFRQKYSSSFIDEFKDGVIRSFEYLQNDLNSLELNYAPLLKQEELEIFKSYNNDNLNIRLIDKSLKKRGFIISKKTRDEILDKKELVISHKIAISLTKDFIYIATLSKIDMDKKFKDLCRRLKIPKNIRAYLYEINFDLKKLAIL